MKKRRLPRHVDSRTKVLGVPVKKFLMIAPIEVTIFIIGFQLFINKSLDYLFLAILIILPIHFFFYETKNKESGFDSVRDRLKIILTGDVVYERSVKNVSPSERFTVNQIKRKKAANK